MTPRSVPTIQFRKPNLWALAVPPVHGVPPVGSLNRILLTVGPAIQKGLPLFNLAEGLDAQFLAPFTLAIARMPRLPADIYFTRLFGHQFLLVHILCLVRIIAAGGVSARRPWATIRRALFSTESEDAVPDNSSRGLRDSQQV